MSRYLVLSILITLQLASSFSLSAQVGRIDGLVSSTEGPLGYATVSIREIESGVTTDSTGKFSFDAVPTGEYIIEASFLGYSTASQLVVVEMNQTTNVELFLKSGHLQMKEIVVTGTMKPRYVSDSPIKVDVITARQLQTYLPTASSSIVENIQLVNGVQEVVACGVCYTNSISINGLPGPYTAVLMDGTPIYGNLASVYGLNGIPNMIIDRFEIIKGPSSTLYGSEAVAGVINIITKDPSDQPLLSIDLMGTTHLESFGNLAFAPTIGKTDGYIGLNHAYVNDFDDVNEDGFGDGINMDRYSIFTKWNIHRKSGKKFSLAGKFYYEDRRNGVQEYLEDRNYRTLRGNDSIYGESIYTERAELFGTYEFNTKPDLKIDYSLSHHHQDSYYGSDSYLATQQIAFANFIWNRQLKNHDVLAGLTMRYNAYDDNSPATKRVVNGREKNKPNNQFIPGVFVQDEVSLTDNFTILGGGRFDHYEAHGFIFSPRLNIKYKPSPWTTLRSNFGTGFRIVNLFTEDHAFVTGQREVRITESLQPEESYNLSLNVNQVYSAMGGSGSIDVEGYFTHFTNKIIPDYDTPGQIVYDNSDGYAQTMGIGINLSHSFGFPLALDFGANLQRAVEVEVNDKGENMSRDIEFAPRWSGVLSVNYIWRKYNLTFAYTARLTGPMALPEVFDIGPDGKPLEAPRPLESQPFSLHNFQINKDFGKNFSLYCGIQNLLNFRQTTSPLIGYNDPTSPIGFSDYFDTSYAYAPNHGREFYLGFRWKLERPSE